MKLRIFLAVLAAALFVAAVQLVSSGTVGSIKVELGVGYYAGATMALGSQIIKRFFWGKMAELVSINPVFIWLDALPLLTVMLLGGIFFYATTANFTSTAFNVGAALAAFLFEFFFWPLVQSIDRANHRRNR